MMEVNWMIHGFTSVTKIQLATTLLTRTAGLLETLDLRTGRLEEDRLTQGTKVPGNDSCDGVRRRARRRSRYDRATGCGHSVTTVVEFLYSVTGAWRAGGGVGGTPRGPRWAAGAGFSNGVFVVGRSGARRMSGSRHWNSLF